MTAACKRFIAVIIIIITLFLFILFIYFIFCFVCSSAFTELIYAAQELANLFVAVLPFPSVTCALFCEDDFFEL